MEQRNSLGAFLTRTGLAGLWLIAVWFGGCQRQPKDSFSPRAGDILFQDADCGALCDAIEKVTTGYAGARFSHVGIAAEDANGLVVIEAVSKGVTATRLEDFLNRSVDAAGRPKVAVGRVRRPYCGLVAGAIEEARSLRGAPYDRNFVIGNGAYYCSELIYEIFLRANGGRPVFELEPMTFKDAATGQRLSEWEEYFEQMRQGVPEGEPGINPGGISRDDAVQIVYVYGQISGLRGN